MINFHNRLCVLLEGSDRGRFNNYTTYIKRLRGNWILAGTPANEESETFSNENGLR